MDIKMFYTNFFLCIILIWFGQCSYVQGIIEHSTTPDDMIFIHQQQHNNKMNDADSYEEKILRARAYVDVLSMSSDDHHYHNQESLPSSSSAAASQYMYGPIEPFNHRNDDQHHNSVRFEWMHPFEFYECDME
nr:uncharacterized protein LOC124494450 [Dermatophagoides farinae]